MATALEFFVEQLPDARQQILIAARMFALDDRQQLFAIAARKPFER